MARTKHIFMPENHMDRLYNSRNPLVRHIHRQRLAVISSYFPQEGNLNVLDAGCGEGHMIETLRKSFPQNAYYGVDITDVALKMAKARNPKAMISKQDLTRLKFKGSFFDVIICTEVLEHIYEYEKVLQEFVRVLKKGGLLMISFPNELNWTISRILLLRFPFKVPDHVNAFSPGRFSIKGLKKIRTRNLPFDMPFALSLGSLVIFKNA